MFDCNYSFSKSLDYTWSTILNWTNSVIMEVQTYVETQDILVLIIRTALWNVAASSWTKGSFSMNPFLDSKNFPHTTKLTSNRHSELIAANQFLSKQMKENTVNSKRTVKKASQVIPLSSWGLPSVMAAGKRHWLFQPPQHSHREQPKHDALFKLK